MSEQPATTPSSDLPAGLRKADYGEIRKLEDDLGLEHSPTPARLLTAEDILSQPALPREDVTVPEWGGYVIVQGLTAQARDAYYAGMAIYNQGGQRIGMNPDNATAKLVAKCVVNQDGTPLFSEEHIARLGAMSAVALDRVADVAQRLSGMEEGQLEKMGKDSAPSPNGASG